MKISGSETFDESPNYKFSIESPNGLLDVVYYPENAETELTAFFNIYLLPPGEEPFSDRAMSVSEPYTDYALQLLKKQIEQKFRDSLKVLIEEIKEQTLREKGSLTRAQAKAMREEIEQMAARMRKERMRTPGRGRPHKWNIPEITKQVRQVVASFIKPREITYANVAMRLNMESGGALRKLLERHNIDWKALKKRT